MSLGITYCSPPLGPVCEAAFAERHIRAMANAAHLVVQHARDDMRSGKAAFSRCADWQLTDGCVEEALVPAYALVAIAA